jgi:hypothetical protein
MFARPAVASIVPIPRRHSEKEALFLVSARQTHQTPTNSSHHLCHSQQHACPSPSTIPPPKQMTNLGYHAKQWRIFETKLAAVGSFQGECELSGDCLISSRGCLRHYRTFYSHRYTPGCTGMTQNFHLALLHRQLVAPSNEYEQV